MIQAAVEPSERRRQTAAAREAFNRKFAGAEARSEHFRQLARRSHEGRLTLSSDEAAALVDAYAILGRIAERARQKIESSPQEAA